MLRYEEPWRKSGVTNEPPWHRSQGAGIWVTEKSGSVNFPESWKKESELICVTLPQLSGLLVRMKTKNVTRLPREWSQSASELWIELTHVNRSWQIDDNRIEWSEVIRPFLLGYVVWIELKSRRVIEAFAAGNCDTTIQIIVDTCPRTTLGSEPPQTAISEQSENVSSRFWNEKFVETIMILPDDQSGIISIANGYCGIISPLRLPHSVAVWDEKSWHFLQAFTNKKKTVLLHTTQ